MYRSKSKYLLFDKHFIVLTFLVLGLVAGVSVVGEKTQRQQQASEPVNLNSAAEIDSSINSNRTMGPKTRQGNFSNSLPSVYLGNLEISVSSSNDSNVLSLAKWTMRGSNPRHLQCKCNALPAELIVL